MSMVQIDVKSGETIEQALRRLNREVFRAGILKELKEREYHKKDSEKRREIMKERQRRNYSNSKRGGRRNQ